MRVLIATDGSRGAINAGKMVAAFPHSAEADVTLVGVSPLDETVDADGLFAPVEAVLSVSGANVERQLRHGVPAEELLRAEATLAPDLLVIGSRGRSAVARFNLGSVAEQVATCCRGPVLIAWPGHEGIQRAVVGLDRSPDSARSVEWLRRFGLLRGSSVHLAGFVGLREVYEGWKRRSLPPARALLRAIEREVCRQEEQRLERLAAALRPAVAEVSSHVRSGDPATGLLRLAEERLADLLVIGTRRMGGMSALLLNSTSDAVLSAQSCSLLVLKQRRFAKGVSTG